MASQIIVHITHIIGKSVEMVDDRLGNPIAASGDVPVGAQEFMRPGGAFRNYTLGDYGLTVYFNLQGVAVALQCDTGLLKFEYTVEHYAPLLARFGIVVSREPDLKAPAMRGWRNLHGYGIRVFALPKGHVWSVLVYRNQNWLKRLLNK